MPPADEPPKGIVGIAIETLSAYHTAPDPPRVRLNANESAYPIPLEARTRIAQMVSELELNRYPDRRAAALRRSLARRLEADESELVLGVGSDEVIAFLMAAFGRPQEGRDQASVLLVEPSFVMVPITAKIHGLDPVFVPLRESSFAIDVDAMLRAIAQHRPNLIFLASPNNPTGNDFGDDALRTIVEAAPDSLVVIDEAYAPFRKLSRNGWVDDYANVAVLGTLSKIGFAALRLGWVRLRPALAEQLEKVRPPYNLNALTQGVGCVLLDEFPEVIVSAVEQTIAERARLEAALSEIDRLDYVPSAANFVLIRHADAGALHARLLEDGIGVRRFSKNPTMADYLRVTVGSAKENDAFLESLRAGLSSTHVVV